MGKSNDVDRREFLKSVAVAATAATATTLGVQAADTSSTSGPRDQPNILLLIGEQHNPRVMGVAGHPVIKTPHLDGLAAGGVYFPKAYCATPLCVPGRVAMFTSRFGHETGATENIYTELIGEKPTLARSLREAGYRTCHIGKTHLGLSARIGTPQGRRRWHEAGFDEDFATTGKMGAGAGRGGGAYVAYIKRKGLTEKLKADYARRQTARKTTLGECEPSVVGVEDYHDQWVSRTADRWLQSVSTDRPFYLSVNWIGPHAFRDAPGRYATMYDRTKIDPPIDDPMTRAPQEIRKRRHETMAKLEPDDWRGVRASYYGMVSLLDDGIGMILQTLRRRGMLDNTLIVYTADHGEMLCDHGCVYKTMMYEQSAAIPFIVHWPQRFMRGLTSTSNASQVDLAPTLLEAAKAKPFPLTHGRSLMPILTDGAESDEPVFCEWKSTRMVRWGSYKYIADHNWDVQQLFNLDEDPSELVNLVDRYSDVVARSREMIDAWMARTGGADQPPTA